MGNYDPLIHLLLSERNVWRVVDAYDPAKYPDHYTSPVYAMLYRRGFDVVMRLINDEIVVWSRWPHPVPQWVVVSERDPEQVIDMTATTTGPDWDQLSIFDEDE